MDITSLYYFAEVAKDLHFTKTANRLFISQQTLSNHIRRVESHYGVALLYRKPVVALTHAGEKVLEFCQALLNDDAGLRMVLSDVASKDGGVVRVGSSLARANYFLPRILPVFAHKYPHVEVRYREAVSSELESAVLNGELDFALTISEVQTTRFKVLKLLQEQVYLCVSDMLLEQYYKADYRRMKSVAIHSVDVADFAQLPYVMYDNRLGHTIKGLFADRQLNPKVVMTCPSSTLALRCATFRSTASFITQMCLMDLYNELPADMNIFPVYTGNAPLLQSVFLFSQHDIYQSKPNRFFLGLLSQLFEQAEQSTLARIA